MPNRRLGFDDVRELTRELPGVEESSALRGPSLKVRGNLLACPAIHKSAEPDSLVVKIGLDRRDELIAADPDVYYVTDHYVNYPTVLVRMPRIHRDALRGLLVMAWQFASQEGKAKKARVGKRRTSRRAQR